MTRSVAALLLACTLPLVAGCDSSMPPASGPSVQFVAANSSTVIVDYPRGVVAELDAARQMAAQKCGLFGGSGAVLESLNTVAGNRERASFLCK